MKALRWLKRRLRALRWEYHRSQAGRHLAEAKWHQDRMERITTRRIFNRGKVKP